MSKLPHFLFWSFSVELITDHGGLKCLASDALNLTGMVWSMDLKINVSLIQTLLSYDFRSKLSSVVSVVVLVSFFKSSK